MKLREQKKKKTKASILTAAIKLFSDQGYDRTSIEQIAREAGVGKGTVYSYFHTKKDIIKGFCEFELEQIHEKLVSRSDQDAPVLDQMKTIYMMEFNHITSNKEFGRLFLRESVFPDDESAKDSMEMDQKYLELFFPIFATAQERGELRQDLDMLYITAHFYGLYLLVISAWYSGHINTEEVETTMETLFRQALEGLQPNR